MAHFAQLDDNNIVTTIIVVHNNELLDQDGDEIEQKGIDFCKSLFGQDTNWIQTSYNASFRKNYACGGGTYNKELNAFIAPKPYNSWILNEVNCKWEAPTPIPEDGKIYMWNEVALSWEEITNIAQQPYASWILNTDTFVWEAPIEKPDQDKPYAWDELTISWKEITKEI